VGLDRMTRNNLHRPPLGVDHAVDHVVQAQQL
jgi:hypothetical protein